MSSDIALSATNLSKSYHLYAKPQDRLKQMLFGRNKKYYNEFWALRDVDISIKKGSTVGILGRNGAGKSTLLQIISGVLTPTTGEVVTSGRVSALLELGTGFNPEFTGRENVYLNATINGLTQKEIDEKFDDIAAFADIGQFINHPVKTYSSGMFVRLAFAVATHVDPEILIVDEALAVGDAKFQARCFRKFESFKEKKKTILFVTHATDQITRHCDSAILLENGHVFATGEPKEVVNKYLDLLFGVTPNKRISTQTKTFAEVPKTDLLNGLHSLDEDIAEFVRLPIDENSFVSRAGYNKSEFRWGSGRASLVDYLLISGKKKDAFQWSPEEPVTVYLKVQFNEEVRCPIYGLTIKTPDGVTVYGNNSRDVGGTTPYQPRRAGDIITVSFKFMPKLIAGPYLLSFGIAEETDDGPSPLDRRYDSVEVHIMNPRKSFGLAELNMDIAVVNG